MTEIPPDAEAGESFGEPSESPEATDERPAGPGEPDPAQAIPDAPPTLPGRGAFLLAIGAIALAGFFGAVIGYGLTDLQTRGDNAAAAVLGAVVGAVIAVVGVGVVARLALRAYADWKQHPPER